MSDNPMEKAQKLGQQLFEIQTSTMSRLTTLQQQNLERYFEMTREFTSRLPEAQDPKSMMDLQREMAQNMWQNYQEANESTMAMVREAWDQVGAAYRDALDNNGGDKT